MSAHTRQPINISDFPGNAFATPKALRESALHWQLLALGAQAKAIAAIAAEHHISLDDLGPENLLERAQDIVKTATWVGQNAEVVPVDELLRTVVALRDSGTELKSDVARFVRNADQRAHFRLSSLLPILFAGNEGDPLEQPAELVDNSDKLAVSAGSSCFKAESEQHGTFALQINSVCDLALEQALSALVDVANKE